MTTTATPARTVQAYEGVSAPTVEIVRLTGQGPRMSGDVYRATVVDGGEITDSLDRTLIATYVGRQGGHPVFEVGGHNLSGDLAFLTVQYGDKADVTGGNA